jgi:polysaccharide export outer membrane protein
MAQTASQTSCGFIVCDRTPSFMTHLSLLSIVLCFVCTACTSAPPTLPPRLPTSSELQTLKSANHLGAGDIVEVRVYREPELSGLYHVGIDGRFNFPLIGEVNASAGGVSQLTTELTERLKREYLRDPQVTVLLKESRSKKVFVLGLVKKPGSYVYEA